MSIKPGEKNTFLSSETTSREDYRDGPICWSCLGSSDLLNSALLNREANSGVFFQTREMLNNAGSV